MAALSGAVWGDFELRQAKFAPSVSAGAHASVQSHWLAQTAQKKSYKIFVHALAADGHLVAGHDAMPLNDLRPMTTLPAGEDVQDNHGLASPMDFRGPLRLIAGNALT